MERVADYIMSKIHQEGVNHIFMVTGRGILYLSDAVAKKEDLQGVSVHHEQTASFAAMAYAQYNDNIGACLVSTGCASTNAMTGVLCAWQDNVPCVFISGQNMLNETVRYTGKEIRTFGSQESDIISLVEPITKYAVMLTDASKVVYEVEKAIYLAKHGRKGPVWIDIPLDVQNMRIEPDELEHYIPDEELEYKLVKEQIEYVKEAFLQANRPVVLIGSGIRSAGAIGELEIFIKKNKIPLVYSSSAPDTYRVDEELSVGTVGSMGGTRAGNFAIQNSDLVLAIGNRLSPVTTGSEYEKFAREAKIIVIDVDAAEHTKDTVRIDKIILSDAKYFLEQMNRIDLKQTEQEWINKCLHWKKIFPMCEEKYKLSEKVDLYYLAECLSKEMAKDAIIITDAGLEELIIPTSVAFRSEQRCIHPNSQGSMGYALPAILGAYYSSGKPVIAVIGDGSIMMNLQELQTISYLQIPVKILVINNNMYSVIRKRQVDFFRTRTIGTEPENGVAAPCFEKLAMAFDLKYIKLSKQDDFENKFSNMLEEEGSVLCEIMCEVNQSYLHSSFTRNQQKKTVRRPLEDQSPFLDRDLFLKEMIIEPIDQ